MDTSRDTTRVHSCDPEPYDATTSQDDLLPIYQQEAMCSWTITARKHKIVAQHGRIKTVPITVNNGLKSGNMNISPAWFEQGHKVLQIIYTPISLHLSY